MTGTQDQVQALPLGPGLGCQTWPWLSNLCAEGEGRRFCGVGTTAHHVYVIT